MEAVFTGSGDHDRIQEEGDRQQTVVLGVHSDDPQVVQAVFQPVQDQPAVALVHRELDPAVLLPVSRQDLRQQIGGGHGGGADGDQIACVGAAVPEEFILQAQDADRVFIHLLPFRRDLQTLGSTHQKDGVQLLLQLADIHADSGLGKEQFLCRLAEAVSSHDSGISHQMFKLHGRSPPWLSEQRQLLRRWKPIRRKNGWSRPGRSPVSYGRRARSEGRPGS